MLENIFTNGWIIRQHREGPLGKYSDELAKSLIEAGYSSQDLRRRFGIISDLNRWLERQSLKLSSFSPKHVNSFVRYRRRKICNIYATGDNATLQLLLKILRADGAIPIDEVPSRWGQGIEDAVEPFLKHLREEKGFSVMAYKRYGNIIYQFLSECFSTKRVVLSELSPDDISLFIIRCEKRWSAKNNQVVASILRAFFRFLFVNGDISRDLSGCIPSIPSWRGKHLPEFLKQNEVIRLLKSCDRRTKKGIRNYALLLLIVRLGLRASEVLHILLDDIDWERGTLLIRGKGAKQSELPMPHDVGTALVSYIKKVRPECKSRALFLRSRAPYRGLNHPSSISTIVRRALADAHLNPKQKGAHLLRYTAATECLRQGATLSQVSELLRHRSIDTTALYAKVDLNRLAELAKPWLDTSL